MAHEVTNGMRRQTNLANESPEYLAKRDELRLAEIELMRQRERVAELRRQLPEGAIVKDYTFEEGPASLDEGDTPTRTVRLSELFTGPDRVVVIYHFMYGKKNTKPCPMCTLVIDGWNGVVRIQLFRSLRETAKALFATSILMCVEKNQSHILQVDQGQTNLIQFNVARSNSVCR